MHNLETHAEGICSPMDTQRAMIQRGSMIETRCLMHLMKAQQVGVVIQVSIRSCSATQSALPGEHVY